MIKIIIAIAIVALLNIRELLNSKSRGKVMGIYFAVMSISLFLAILINLDKEPTSPIIIIMSLVKSLGWGEG